MKNNFLNFAMLLTIILTLNDCGSRTNKPETKINALSRHEVVYYLFPRSFYDSNGDLIGDFNGVREKLDYLQELGVTSILMTPLYQSIFYHNYFAVDYEKLDPEFGTMEDYLALIKEIHRRGMKFYMDMETQYITSDQDWYKKAMEDSKSKFNNYFFHDSVPFKLQSYNGEIRSIAQANLYNPDVKEYFYSLYRFYVDPNKDGKFDDGVDGYRIDHIMDNLDNLGRLKGLLSEFWNPLFRELRKINPDIKIIGEQANWASFGQEYFQQADLDYLFAFRIRFALVSFDKDKIIQQSDSTYIMTPKNKNQLIFIENHDLDRFASAMGGNLSKLKIGAAFNLLLKGIPLIYYGQEIGMKGIGLHGISDGNDIPKREAFEWYKEVERPGMALWYKNSGPWWTGSNLKSNDGLSLEEEKPDSNSLWNLYRTLIKLHKDNPSLIDGECKFISNNNKQVVTFIRWDDKQSILVVINLSGENQNILINPASSPVKLNEKDIKSLFNLNGRDEISAKDSSLSLQLKPYDMQVYQLN